MRHSATARAQMVRLFSSTLIFGRRILRKSRKCQGPLAMEIRPENNMVSKGNHLIYHFSIAIHLYLANFYAQNTKKKLAMGNAQY